MDSNEFLLVLIGPYSSLWVLMVSLQVLMRPFVCLSVLISLYAILSVVKGIYRS